MSVQEKFTSDAAEIRGAIGIPKFVRIPAGLKRDEEGALVIDEATGDPIEEMKLFYVQRTGKALKQIIERSASESERARALLDNEKEMTDEQKSEFRTSQSMENIDFLYHGLSLILLDPETGENVPPEWLDEHLDFDVAAAWMDTFVPSTGGGPGNATEASELGSETGPSTDTSTPELEPLATEA